VADRTQLKRSFDQSNQKQLNSIASTARSRAPRRPMQTSAQRPTDLTGDSKSLFRRSIRNCDVLSWHGGREERLRWVVARRLYSRPTGSSAWFHLTPELFVKRLDYVGRLVNRNAVESTGGTTTTGHCCSPN
jgi:hypothetical protein